MSEPVDEKYTVVEHHCRREFLNLPFCYKDGTVFSEIELYRYPNRMEAGVTFRIRDCERVAELAFGLKQGNPEYIKNALYKCDVILEHVNTFREALISAQQQLDTKTRQNG